MTRVARATSTSGSCAVVAPGDGRGERVDLCDAFHTVGLVGLPKRNPRVSARHGVVGLHEPARSGDHMASTPDQQGFNADGVDYDRFMGRYSRPLAGRFIDVVGLEPGHATLDVGCGPGALTTELAKRCGAAAVSAVDPSPSFVEACRARHPDVDVRVGGAEELDFPDATFDRVMAQLVLHFVDDAEQAAREFRRVLRPAGAVPATSTWWRAAR